MVKSMPVSNILQLKWRKMKVKVKGKGSFYIAQYPSSLDRSKRFTLFAPLFAAITRND